MKNLHICYHLSNVQSESFVYQTRLFCVENLISVQSVRKHHMNLHCILFSQFSRIRLQQFNHFCIINDSLHVRYMTARKTSCHHDTTCCSLLRPPTTPSSGLPIFLKREVTICLVLALVKSTYDYCNSALVQMPQNDCSTAISAENFHHMLVVLIPSLHWLPLCQY